MCAYFISADSISGRVRGLRDLRDLHGVHVIGDTFNAATEQHLPSHRQHWRLRDHLDE